LSIVGTEPDLHDALRTRPTIATPPPAHFAPAASARRSPALPAPTRLAIPVSDWEVLVATRANAIVVGNEDAAMGVWTAIWTSLQKPICWSDAGQLSLPRNSAGTLILKGAHLLDASSQQQVFEWISRDARATRVLATTPLPLFPLVQGGTFLEALYYRLNMLLLIV
jgi:hypothetical protein